MGSGNIVGPYSVILGNVVIGDSNWIGPHVVIGSPPEHRNIRLNKGHHGFGPIHIGSNNVIHEFVAIQAPTQNATVVGSGCFIMDRTHIAHDCQISDGVTCAPGVVLAGHVQVDMNANLGMNSSVLQHTFVGAYSMAAMGSAITQKMPPFSIFAGVPGQFRGLNIVGLQRSSFDFVSPRKISKVIKGESDLMSLPPEMQDVFIRWQESSRI